MTEIKMTLFSHSRKHLIVNTTLPQYDLEQIQGSCFLFTYDKIKEKSPKLLGFLFVLFLFTLCYGVNTGFPIKMNVKTYILKL